MDAMDADRRRRAPASRSARQLLYVMLRRDPDMTGIAVTPSKSLSKAVILSDGSDSSSATSPFDADFDVLVGDNSDAATDRSTRVKLDVEGWEGLRVLTEGSRKLSAAVSSIDSNFSDCSNRPSTASSSSEADFDRDVVARDNSEGDPDGSSPGIKPGRWVSKMTLLRRPKNLLSKLRTKGGTEPSNSSGDVTPSDSPHSSSATSSFGALCDVDSDNSEAASDGSFRVERDAPGWRGFPNSLMRGSKKLFAKRRPEGGMQSPTSDILGEEAESASKSSKLEEGCPDACEGGQTKRNSQRTAFQDGEPPSSPKSQLKLHKPPDGRQHGPKSRDLKGRSGVRKSVIKLRKGKVDEYRRRVVVNGVPIKDADVKRAEAAAGPIHPGGYWYDIQAGFWGVESGPCLGIIPPCILELNGPMSKCCAGGHTNILVNGRELHEKDLERLSLRGFPTVPGSAYVMSIDGRVTDESSGKFVTCLGMLAPSVKRNGRGAGIYVPFVD